MSGIRLDREEIVPADAVAVSPEVLATLTNAVTEEDEDDFTVGFNQGAAWAWETATKQELADLADVASQGQWCQFAFREGHTLAPTLLAKGLHPDNGVLWLNAHDAWAQGLIFGALEWSTYGDGAA